MARKRSKTKPLTVTDGPVVADPDGQPLGHVVTLNNGVFTRTTRTSRDPSTGESEPQLAFEMIAQAKKKAGNTSTYDILKSTLDQIEDELEPIASDPPDELRDRTAKEASQELKYIQREMQHLKDDLTGTPHPGRARRSIIGRIAFLVSAAIKLGEQRRICSVSRNLVEPMRKKNNSRNGGDNGRKTQQAMAEKRHQQWQQWVDDYRADNPKVSHTAACKRVAEREGVDSTTLFKNVINRTPKRGKK